MSVVPSTVTTAREQIREAIRLSVVDSIGGTSLSTWEKYSSYTSSDNYPLSKAIYVDATGAIELTIGSSGFVQNDVLIQVIPQCTESTFETITSEAMNLVLPAINPDTVRAFMDSSYQSSLVNITPTKIEVSATNESNTYAFLNVYATVKYRVST